MISQQSKRHDSLLALTALAALTCPTRAQDPMACLPADKRPVCLAYPTPERALKTTAAVVLVPGVGNNGASRVAAAAGYAEQRGLPVYGILNDTDPIVLWDRGALRKPIEGAARLVDAATKAIGVERISIPLSGFIIDSTHAALGIAHAALGAATEVATARLSAVIVDHLKAGNRLEIVAHSQGGIITANALVLARNDPAFIHLTDHQWLHRTGDLSVVCFGTPQRVFNINDVVSFVHAGDPLIGVVDKLRETGPVRKLAGNMQQLTRDRIPLMHGPEMKPRRVEIAGEFSSDHAFESYQKNLPRFYAELIRQDSRGNGERAADRVAELGENQLVARQTLEEITLRVFGEVGSDGPTEFQGHFAARMVQYWKQGREFAKGWDTSTIEALYHNQGAAYPWERPAAFVPRGMKGSDFRRLLVSPPDDPASREGADEPYADDTSAIQERKRSSSAVADSARDRAQRADAETRQRNDARVSESRNRQVPQQPTDEHRDAVAANRAAFDDAANRPSQLTDDRSAAFNAGLAEQRRRVEAANAEANAEARRATEKSASKARERAEDAKDKEEQDRKNSKLKEDQMRREASDKGEAKKQNEEIGKRLDKVEESSRRAEEQAKAAADASRKAAKRKPSIINKYYQDVRNYFFPQSTPPPAAPRGEGGVILP